MKSSTFGPLVAVVSFSLSGFSQSLLADGPEDLEALAEKAREAAEDISEELEGVPQSPTVKPEAKKKKKVAAILPNEEVKEEVQVVEKVEEEAEKEAAPPDLKKRGEKMGLLAHVSPDVSAVMSLRNGERLWGEVTESKMGAVLLDVLAENEVDLTDPESPGARLAALFAEEFLIVSGQGTAKQIENLTSLSGLSNKYQTALMIQLWVMGGADAFGSNPFEPLMAAVKDDPDYLVNLVSALEMPPLLLAARVSDDEQRDEFAAFLEMGAGMALEVGEEEMPFLKAAEAEFAGITFNGLSVDGELLVQTLEDEMGLSDNLSNFLDPATSKDLINSLKEKNLVLLGGVSQDSVYLYLGKSAEEIPLVDDVAKGLVSSEHFSFVDDYIDEDLVSVFWTSEELVEVGATSQAILGDYIAGIQLGLEGSDSLGETKKLRRLFKRLLKLESDVLALGHSQPAAGVSFMRGDGLYSESFGGYVDGYYDWETPHQLGVPGGEVFMSIQSVVNPESDEVALRYVETAFAAAYEMALLMGELEDAPAEMEGFLEGLFIFDEKMKGNALALWQGIRASEAGLGNESIFEVDLAGSWPTVPGVPGAMIEQGLAPRMSFLSPVTDRAKLAESWKEVEGAAAGLLKDVSEMTGEDIPMQKPMSSQNDGLKTWFFPIPMQTDDFVPSITLNDEFMIMGTSKERAIALAQMAKKEGSGEKGVVMEMSFAPLKALLSNWMTLISEDPEAILKDEEALEFFQGNQEVFNAVIDAMDEFDSIRSHTRMADGQLRSSSHFKTK